MDFRRQAGIVDNGKLAALKVTLIGAGAVGSFTALTLTKLGVAELAVYDEDGVSEHNIPNQFYRVKDADRQFKVNALQDIVQEFNGVKIDSRCKYYKDQPLTEVVIVATDSMESRKLVWKQVKKQQVTKWLIDSRMGGQVGLVYRIDPSNKEDVKFYEETLHSDDEGEQVPCTERAIIDNVLMISALISRAVRSILSIEAFPREIAMDIRNLLILTRE